ncbi:hypothetical protein DFJ77DRAFT_331650 [Powellomyces hirtus]|nr:hypothetical protein DFJ77DRAFT_331650 [Powellomyces hirtus]
MPPFVEPEPENDDGRRNATLTLQPIKHTQVEGAIEDPVNHIPLNISGIRQYPTSQDEHSRRSHEQELIGLSRHHTPPYRELGNELGRQADCRTSPKRPFLKTATSQPIRSKTAEFTPLGTESRNSAHANDRPLPLQSGPLSSQGIRCESRLEAPQGLFEQSGVPSVLQPSIDLESNNLQIREGAGDCWLQIRRLAERGVRAAEESERAMTAAFHGKGSCRITFHGLPLKGFRHREEAARLVATADGGTRFLAKY